MNTKELLGLRVKEFRKQKKLTQEKLAEMANIEIPSLSNIENGKNYPNNETLYKLATALNVRPFELFIFEYYQNSAQMLKEMVALMEKDDELIRKMYKYFLCIK